jgi:putative MATE family efflux protein
MESPRPKDKSEEFATGRTFSLIIKYSIPTIVGMLANALYALIDRAFVGNLPGMDNGMPIGTLGMDGINIAMPATIVIFAVAMLAGAGAAANISLSLGRGQRDKAEEYIGNGLTLGVAFALIATAVFIVFRVPILQLFGATGDDAVALPYAEKYLTVILVGTTINTFGFCLSRYILAQGFTTVSMTAMFIGVGVNLALAPLFLYVFHWGVAGSAAATVVAQTVSAAFSLQYFLRKRMPLHIRAKYLKPDWPVLGRIVSIGVSPGSLQLAMALVQVVLNNSLNNYGTAAIAAMGAVNSVSQVLMMPVFGINQGVQPIIGFNYGARHYHRVRILLLQAIVCAVCLMLFFWTLIMIGARTVVMIFGEANSGLMQIGPTAVRLFLMALPLVGFQVVSSNYFQAVGKPLYSLVLTMSRQVVFLLPAVLIMPIFLGMNGVFAAGPVADTLSAIMTGLFLVVELRKLRGQAEARETELSALKQDG